MTRMQAKLVVIVKQCMDVVLKIDLMDTTAEALRCIQIDCRTSHQTGFQRYIISLRKVICDAGKTAVLQECHVYLLHRTSV